MTVNGFAVRGGLEQPDAIQRRADYMQRLADSHAGLVIQLFGRNVQFDQQAFEARPDVGHAANR